MLNQQSHIKHFSDIYAKNIWNGSGNGSYPDNTIEYRNFITSFLKEKNIKTIIDYGCGDWQFSKLIDWSNVEYLGIECVPNLIENHNSMYTKENIKFVFLEDCKIFFSKYTADLLILKDVIQHWINDEIIHFLDNTINNFKYILITNSCDQKTDWQDTPERSRPLSCDFYPLKKYNIKKLAVITNGASQKEISLIQKIIC